MVVIIILFDLIIGSAPDNTKPKKMFITVFISDSFDYLVTSTHG